MRILRIVGPRGRPHCGGKQDRRFSLTPFAFRFRIESSASAPQTHHTVGHLQMFSLTFLSFSAPRRRYIWHVNPHCHVRFIAVCPKKGWLWCFGALVFGLPRGAHAHRNCGSCQEQSGCLVHLMCCSTSSLQGSQTIRDPD